MGGVLFIWNSAFELTKSAVRYIKSINKKETFEICIAVINNDLKMWRFHCSDYLIYHIYYMRDTQCQILY